jgi:hypothetical protein
MSYCIIKELIIKGKTQNVILLNDELTVMEFDNYDISDIDENLWDENGQGKLDV